MSDNGRTIALIGGGRWGRVHASNLSQLLSSRDRVIWVSQHNQDRLREAISKFPEDGPPFQLSTNLDKALSEKPTAAIVVTSPQTHVTVTAACLRAGADVFVEKPLAFTESEARSLVALSSDSNRLLAVGLHLLSASYLHHFKSVVAKRDIAKISLRWFDPAHEERYGESKRTDVSTPLVDNVYPHIWSIIRVLTGSTQQKIDHVSEWTGESISFQSMADNVVVNVRCGRNSDARERKIGLEFRDGGAASFDFTQEPGATLVDGAPLTQDPLWGHTPRPLMSEVEEFLAQSSSRKQDASWPHLAENCLDSVVGAEILNAKTK